MSNVNGLVVDRGALPRLATRLERRAGRLRGVAAEHADAGRPEVAESANRRARELEARAANHRAAASRGMALVTEGDGNA